MEVPILKRTRTLKLLIRSMLFKFLYISTTSSKTSERLEQCSPFAVRLSPVVSLFGQSPFLHSQTDRMALPSFAEMVSHSLHRHRVASQGYGGMNVLILENPTLLL